MNPWLLTLALLHVADSGTTHYGLVTGRAHEVVLPTQNPYVVDAIGAGQFGIELALWHWGKAHGHRKAVIVALVAVGAAHGFAAVHNVHELTKGR